MTGAVDRATPGLHGNADMFGHLLAVHARLAVIAMLAMAAACAPRAGPVAPPVKPAYPQFPFPTVTEDLARTSGRLATDHERAWTLLQSGRADEAARDFERVLSRESAFYPAEAGLGFTELAQKQAASALQRFDGALARAPSYAPALLGRAETLLMLKRDGDALAAYEAVLAADPSLTDVRERIEVIRFRAVQADVGAAEQARQRGDLEQSRAYYQRAITASPESGFLYRDLARVEGELGNADEALTHVERAVALDPNDASSHQVLGQLQEQRGDVDAALTAYRRASELDPTLDVAPRITALETRAELARLPAAYRAIPGAVAVARGDLAAMFGIRLAPVIEAASKATVLVTDTRQHWAESWIQGVAQSGVMDVYANHTFQPDVRLTRGELATAASRVLALLGKRAPTLTTSWDRARSSFADIGPTHLLYEDASQAVAAGVMRVGQDRTFAPSQTVSGGEAVAAVERLAQLAEQAGMDTSGPRVDER
ncbi:MAG: tetratricopeptide repeat protein [Luteitalea sp.]|nr:tetratricopeptide repeat protein [Luteitalea sp.]